MTNSLNKQIPTINIQSQPEYEPDYQYEYHVGQPMPRWISKATLILEDARIDFEFYFKDHITAEACIIYLDTLFDEYVRNYNVTSFEEIKSKLKLLRQKIREKYTKTFVISSTHIYFINTVS